MSGGADYPVKYFMTLAAGRDNLLKRWIMLLSIIGEEGIWEK